MMADSVPSGWYRDPTGQGDGRYWNGVSWTDSVSRAGLTVSAPMDPTQAQTPPVPGSALATPTPAPASAAQTVVVKEKGSPVGAIIAAVVAALVVIGIIFAVSNSDSDDDTETDTTEAPATTEAPPTTDG